MMYAKWWLSKENIDEAHEIVAAALLGISALATLAGIALIGWALLL